MTGEATYKRRVSYVRAGFLNIGACMNARAHFGRRRTKFYSVQILNDIPCFVCSIVERMHVRAVYIHPRATEKDGAYFGPLKCRKEYIGDSLPTLISNQKESHLAFREHAMGAFRSRVPYGQPAMTRATDIFYNNLWENGEQSCLCDPERNLNLSRQTLKTVSYLIGVLWDSNETP